VSSYNAVRDAIMTKLNGHYPGTNIYGEEIQQGFSRPAFFVQLLPEAGSVINAAHREKNLLVDICYFSSEAFPFRDMWEVAADLDILVGSGVPVDDRVLNIIDPHPEIVDDVLHYQFKLMFIDSQEGITVDLDTPGETVTIPTDPRQESLGYTEDTIALMRELEVKEEL